MPADVVQMWRLTLALAAVVIVVVAMLLILIAVAATRIDRHAAAIWAAGKDIAANTVQIWQLQKTNATAREILHVAQGIAACAASIDGRLARLEEALTARRGGAAGS